MTAILECDCGDCRTCHRAMGLDRPTPTPVTLSGSTLRILANLDKPRTPEPKIQRRNPNVVRPASASTRTGWCKRGLHELVGDNVDIRTRSNRTTRECIPCRKERQAQRRAKYGATPRGSNRPEPIPCIECGGMIGARISGWSGWVLDAREGRCQVCADRPKFEAFLAEYEQMPDGTRTKGQINQAKKARHHLERVLKDGRAHHPNPPKHGAGQAYIRYGCRCVECSRWKSADNKARRDAQHP